MENTIVIIDGNSLINRAYYAMQRPMITKDGIYTQGVYGFINMLQKIEKDYEPGYLTVAFDMKAPTFRHLEYDAYKAGRKAMPTELAMQMPIMKDVLRAMRIKILEMEGFEADDIIGTVSVSAQTAGLEPLIITGDKDALQLVSDKTRVLITKKGITDFEIYDVPKMKERYGMTPAQFIDLKGLMGDSSDNIPGIPGIGEKTGIKLLAQFGTLENLLSRTGEISSDSLRKKVEENEALARMSKRLATINTNVPIDFDFNELKLTEPDYDELVDLYTKLEFKSFLKRLKIEPSAEQEISDIDFPETQYILIEKDEDIDILERLNGSDKVYIKVFSDMSHRRKPSFDGLLLLRGSEGIYIDMAFVSAEKLIEKLNPMKLNLVGHDIKDDLYVLMSYGFTDFKIAFDTAIAEYVIDPSRSKYEIESLALERLHAAVAPKEEGGVDNDQLDMFSDSRQTLWEQAVRTGHTVFALMDVETQMLAENGLSEVFYKAEMPLIEVLASMEVEGVYADRQFLGVLGKDLKEKIKSSENHIYELAGKEFNINSPLQLGNVLFDDMGLPNGKKTKRGYSTGADVLEKLKDKHPIIDEILMYRNYTKLNSTYVDGMVPLIGEDGKIRAHFRQTVTATGRISCTEPNLQNIPIRQDFGRNLRKAFKAGEGHVLVGADYSQIELRVLAHLSGDEELIAAFNRGDDIHKLTASRVLGIPFDQVTPQERSRAKAVNFGVIYGMSGFGLSEELQISQKEAKKYIDDYFSKHQKVKEYMDAQIKNCREKGFSETILGRKRAIHEISASAYMVRQLGERLAMNSPIQGSAADIIKLAMINVYHDLKANFRETKLILQVHDELILSVPVKDAQGVAKLLAEDMEKAIQLSVKLVADVNQGQTWYDLK